ncbi:MAG TPA: hypothetical protein VGL03_08935 [Thermoanaerobaculia bacterium]|jgi:hypothetical protein
MANSSSRVGVVAVALVVGIVVGYLIVKATAPPTVDQIVTVGPNPTDVNPPTATIGYLGHVFWRSNPVGQRLSIVFPKSGFPTGVTEPPFAGMLTNGNDYNVACSGDSCSSGNVNPNLKYPAGTRLTYKYDQVLNGTRADGRIIIQW